MAAGLIPGRRLQHLNSAQELGCVGWIHLLFLLGGRFLGSCLIRQHGFQLRGAIL